MKPADYLCTMYMMIIIIYIYNTWLLYYAGHTKICVSNTNR